MKIHIVDDNMDIATMMKLYFIKKGHECSVSNDGRNALDILQNQKFDAILLDIAMPEISGIDIINELHANKKMNELNIILISATSVSPEDIQKVINIGAKGVLKKPIEPAKVLEYLLQFS